MFSLSGYCFLAIAGSSDLLSSQQEDLVISVVNSMIYRKLGHFGGVALLISY